MPLPNLPGYFNNSADRAAKGYQKVLFTTGRPLQSAELEAAQDNLLTQLLEVADGLYENGDIVDGLEPRILEGSEAGNLQIAAGKVYLLGRVYTLAQATLTIPMDVKVSVGVRLNTEVITAEQDSLLKDPCVGFDNYQQMGAATIKATVTWGWVKDGGDTDIPDPLGVFYPIYAVDAGNIIIKDVPPAISAVLDAIAGYDYTAHGNYSVDGLQVRFARFEAANAFHPDRYVFTVSNGTVHVRGYNVGRTVDTPLEVNIDFDLASAEAESEAYAPEDGADEYALTLNRSPLNTITAINGLVEVEEELEKGSAGGQDPLASASVEYIIEVKQGATVYTQGVDYILTDGAVDWSPSTGGATEPVSGPYTVKYADRQNLLTNGGDNIVSQSNTQIILTGLVPHTLLTPSLVYVSYTYKLKRVDAITIDLEGTLHRLKGRPTRFEPSAPPIPSNHTKLALIIYDWFNDPVVRDIRTPAVSFDELKSVKNRVDDLFDLIAQERLRNDATAREPVESRGVFVDPFLDNDMREASALYPNSMATVQGLLMLPITASADPPNNYAESLTHHLLPYTQEIVVEQRFRTACSKINPYQAIEPIPARATISPDTDTWIVPASLWNTPIASSFTRIVTDKLQVPSLATSNLAVPNAVQTSQVHALGSTIRPQPITFRIEGFGPGEALLEIRFDGIRYSNLTAGLLPFTSTSPADASGVITGSFSIPAGIPTGEKAVEFFGNSSYGDCTFVGMSEILWPVVVRINTRSGRRRTRKRCDPLAETFTLDEDRILTGVRLKFCKVGDPDNLVYVQLRETTAGLPNQTIIAEGIFDLSTLTLAGSPPVPVNAWSEVLFEIPAHTTAGREYAFVVMTDDPDHSIATAGIGTYAVPELNDGFAGWLTSQPFQNGEMLSSSNASTWTPHPKEDITFQLLCANFTADSSVVNLGTFDAINISDLLARATVLRPSATCDVIFRFTPALTSAVYETREELPLALNTRINGEVLVEAILSNTALGDVHLSPILYPRPQIIKGNMGESASYISRRFNARNVDLLENEFTAIVVFEYLKRPGATIVPTIQSQVLSGIDPVFDVDGLPVTEWLPMVVHREKSVGDGWFEIEYRFDLGETGQAVAPDWITRCKLACTGNPANRVYIRKLRCISKT